MLIGMTEIPRQTWLPSLLFHPQFLARVQPEKSDEILILYQQAVDKHFTSPLRDITQGHKPTEAEMWMLVRTLQTDAVQTAVIPVTHENSAEYMVKERLQILQTIWPSFSHWWLQYLQVHRIADIPVDTLWRCYIPLSQWIVEQKRAVRPDEVYVVGIYGSQGRGKTVMAQALVAVLNHLLDPEIDGQAVTCSIDDYYLSKAQRETLRPPGYDAGPGVSNRGPAGTHDIQWLLRNLREFRHSTPASTTAVGNFQKQRDEQPQEPRIIHGKVGVFILDGWFVGANTDFDIRLTPEGFQRTVAQYLQGDYKTIFDRLDALWAFDTPSVDEILRNREQQEQLLEQSQGKRGMSPEQIRSFVRYFYEQTWTPGVTSPIPQLKDITFLGTIYPNRRIRLIERGGRPMSAAFPASATAEGR
jgi:pantothenate kinase-related protein Tda10